MKLFEQFQIRIKFHDLSVESIIRKNQRAIITVHNHLLILTGVTRWKEQVDEYPTSWISHVLTMSETAAVILIDLELGTIDAEFRNLRLIRLDDFAVLIPRLDLDS